MNQSKALNLGGESESGALDARVPESGAAADCYAVACTATMLANRGVTRTIAPQGNAPARHAVTLHRISGQLHRISERQCNEDVTCPRCHGEGLKAHAGDDDFNPARPGEECPKCKGEGMTIGPRRRNLEAQAREIAEHYGLRVYFQTDPRGCALYLIAPEIVPGEDAAGRNALTRYVYPNDKTHPASFADLQRRWIEANYTRGHAVVRMGR